MSKNQAVKTISSGVAAVVDVPVPELPDDDYILVRTTAVGINPTDWKHLDFADEMGRAGVWIGNDYAGVVEEVGPAAVKNFKKGDRICGPVNGNGLRDTDGSFAKYIHVKSSLQIHTPDNITDEEGATFGISIPTVGQGLYQTLKLPLPLPGGSPPATNQGNEPPLTVFIYGGSTATGIYGIQFAKSSGVRVLTTASPRNFEYLKSLGADAVFDYNSPTVVEDIRAFTNGSLTLAWDCHSSDESSALIAKTMSVEKGGILANLIPVDLSQIAKINDKINVTTTVAYEAFNEPYVYVVDKMEPNPEAYEFAKMFWELSRKLLAEGKVKPVRVIKNKGGEGLPGVVAGMKELKAGKVSAGKLVYTIS